jgi:hypothetical protein
MDRLPVALPPSWFTFHLIPTWQGWPMTVWWRNIAISAGEITV